MLHVDLGAEQMRIELNRGAEGCRSSALFIARLVRKPL